MAGWRRHALTVAAVLGLGVVIPAYDHSAYALTRWESILALLMAGIGLNIASGFAGQLSLGPGAVFGVGAYTAAVMASHHVAGSGLVVLCAGALVAAAAVGVITGVPALRVGGFYLGMVTLYFALILPQVVSHTKFTGGQYGISLLSDLRFSRHLNGVLLYELIVGVVLATVGFTALLLSSRVGRGFITLRTGETLAASLGIVPYRAKLSAFLISALPAGLGGALYLYSQQAISPATVDPNLSIYVFAAVVIGGLGRIWGPVLGGLLVLGLQQYLASFHLYELLVFGALLLAVVLRLPNGLAGIRTEGLLRSILPRPRTELRPTFEPAAASSLPTSVRAPRHHAAVLRLDGVARSFGGVRAVDALDLDVAPGAVHGLVGPNGSGKTTVLNVISGFYRLERGVILIGDHRIDDLNPPARVRAGLGRTFQTPRLVPHLNLLENVLTAVDLEPQTPALSAVLRSPASRRADRHARDYARACLSWVGLESASSRHPDELPHPTRRLAEVARALALRPAFLLLDEPAAGLGQAELKHLRDVITHVAAAGTGVLLVEHNVPFVLGIADRVTVLHQGRAIASGSADEVASDPEVIRVYLGDRKASAT